jgi:hypothetical protein
MEVQISEALALARKPGAASRWTISSMTDSSSN